MDQVRKSWYYSCMGMETQIPVFNLFGEVTVFPDIVHCERIRDRARLHDWVISPHRHRDMAQVLYMENGAAVVRLDGRETTLQDGGFVLVAPRVVHSFSFRKGSEGMVFSFPIHVLAAIEKASPELGQSLSMPRTGIATSDLKTLMKMLASAFRGGKRFRSVRLTALAHGLLAAIGEMADGSEATASRVSLRMQQFDALIAENMGKGWSAMDFASAMSITPGHLNRICRIASGANSSAYIEKAVMAEACRLMAFTQLYVSEIGFRLGFDDPSYFTRRFRLIVGQTPSEYRVPFQR